MGNSDDVDTEPKGLTPVKFNTKPLSEELAPLNLI